MLSGGTDVMPEVDDNTPTVRNPKAKTYLLAAGPKDDDRLVLLP
jgi:hypothetical protein